MEFLAGTGVKGIDESRIVNAMDFPSLTSYSEQSERCHYNTKLKHAHRQSFSFRHSNTISSLHFVAFGRHLHRHLVQIASSHREVSVSRSEGYSAREHSDGGEGNDQLAGDRNCVAATSHLHAAHSQLVVGQERVEARHGNRARFGSRWRES